MAKVDKIKAPEIEGLVGSRSIRGKWLSREGRTWEYYAPADCKPLGRRINVHMWDDGKESHIEAIEGDGRTPEFIRFERVILPDGAGDGAVAEIARTLAEKYLSLGTRNFISPENVVAGMLVSAGFIHDDLMGSEAWQKPVEDGYLYFIRAEPEPNTVTTEGGETFVVDMPMPLVDPEGPVQVGLLHDTGMGLSWTVAPSLEEAIEVVGTDRMPRPGPEEETEIGFASLFSRKPGPP